MPVHMSTRQIQHTRTSSPAPHATSTRATIKAYAAASGCSVQLVSFLAALEPSCTIITAHHERARRGILRVLHRGACARVPRLHDPSPADLPCLALHASGGRALAHGACVRPWGWQRGGKGDAPPKHASAHTPLCAHRPPDLVNPCPQGLASTRAWHAVKCTM